MKKKLKIIATVVSILFLIYLMILVFSGGANLDPQIFGASLISFSILLAIFLAIVFFQKKE